MKKLFDYSAINLTNEVQYKGINAKNLIFAEGFGIKKNPFFNTLPLEGTKGELLVIHALDLKSNVILKSSVFVIPIGNDNYLLVLLMLGMITVISQQNLPKMKF